MLITSSQSWLTHHSNHLPDFCYDPYRLPGYVTGAPKDSSKTLPSQAQWVVNNPIGRRRGRLEGSPGEDFVVPSLMAELLDGAQPEWLRNRTVIFIGDSLDRNLVDFFSHAVFPGPNPHRYLTNATDPAFPEPATASHRVGLGSHRELGFVISNWFIMGVDVERPSSFFHPGEDEPQAVERRLPHFYLPLINPKDGILSSEPEMVVFNSGLWDLVYRSEAAAEAATRSHLPHPHTGTRLTQTELAEHERRMRSFIDQLRLTFPKPSTRLVYRTMPDSARGSADGNAMSITRVRQFDQAHLALIEQLNREEHTQPHPRPIDVLDWAKLTRGLSQELLDLVHFKAGKAQWRKLFFTSWVHPVRFLFFFRVKDGVCRVRVTDGPGLQPSVYAELILNHLRRLILGDQKESEWKDCQAYIATATSSPDQVPSTRIAIRLDDHTFDRLQAQFSRSIFHQNRP